MKPLSSLLHCGRSAGLISRLVFLVGLTSSLVHAASMDEVYRLGPDSEPHEGVPQGTVTEWEKGYDVNYVWGIGTHSSRHGGAILPEMLRWLWRDYPRPPDDPLDDSNRGFLLPPASQ